MADGITIKRQAYNLSTFDAEFEREDPPHIPLSQRLKSCIASKCRCSGECVKKKVLGLFPFLTIMRGYQWKKWIVSDIISGLCVGVIHIPQSMGFAILTSLPPVYGLYASLYPIFIYFLLGTSKHISVGTMAIISILISNVVEREAANFVPSTQTPMQQNDTITLDLNDTMTTTEASESTENMELMEFKVGVAMAVTFTVGVIQLIMSFFKLGLLATFMSMSFIGGFMAGATIHIITSQVPFCLGIIVPRQSGIFRVPKIWYDIFKGIAQANPAEVIISIICIAILVSIKEVINEKFKHRLKVPIPAELLIVIIATMISYLAKLHQRFEVRILKHIPTGLPAPQVPNFSNGTTFIIDSFVIAIVSFAISISLAKFFSQKYHYPIDQDQEMFAYGVMHTFSAFFGGFAGAQAPPRTMVHDSTGGKTQLASLVSALLILMVCLLLAPLFESLPNSVLGSIIIVALIPLLKRFQDLPHMWRVNRYDFFVWIVTFIAVSILDIDIGLAIGILISILTIIVETHMAKGKRLDHAEKTELYAPQEHYKALTDSSSIGLFVFKFHAPLYFANTEAMKNQIFATTINPASLRKDNSDVIEVVVGKPEVQNGTITGETKKENMSNGSSHGSIQDMTPSEKTNNNILQEKSANPESVNVIPAHMTDADLKMKTDNPETLSTTDDVKQCAGVVILDCSAISYIDLMGLNLIKQMQKQYADVGVVFVLANCNEAMQKKLVINGTEIGEFVYPSVQDAVSLMMGNNRETTKF